MSQVLAFDFSFADITFEAAAAAGYVGALGYFSTDPSKNWTATRVSSAHAAGLGIAGAWETTVTRATAGFTAGVTDAHETAAQAAALGYPAGCPLYFAVDETTTWASVAAYFRGAMSVPGILVGAYGSLEVVLGAASAGVPYRWQTEAWSGSTVSSLAHLYQRDKPALTIPHTTPDEWDEDVVLVSTYPWWTTTSAPAVPVPAPSQLSSVPIGATGLALYTVPVPTDANGNGWVLVDELPWPIVGVTLEGSDPTPQADNAYWPGSAHAQERTGKALVSVTGFLAHETANVLVSAE